MCRIVYSLREHTVRKHQIPLLHKIISEMKTIDFLFDLKKIGLPFISVTEGVFKGLCFLVDTGCTESVMFSFVAKHFENDLRTDGEYSTMCGMEGRPVETLKVFGDISFGGSLTTVHFHLLNDSTVSKRVEEDFGFQMHGILGMDFMLANNWIVDIVNRRIIIDEQVEQVA